MLVTKGFGRTFVDFNLGYTFAGDSDDGTRNSRWHYGVAGRRELTTTLWAVGEIVAVTPVDDGSKFVGANIGLQWEVTPGLVLDAAVGTGLHDGPDVTATVGLTWVF